MLPVMFVLVLWTLIVIVTNLFRRMAAVRRGHANLSQYQLLNELPAELQAHKNHIANLFEVPVLFYVICLYLEMKELVDTPFLALAWAYVGLRILHSLVHVTFNRVEVRASLYILSNISLVVIWVRAVLTH